MNGTVYEIMLKDSKLASIDTSTGEVKVCKTLPIGLSFNCCPRSISEYLANLNSFQEWCAGRVLMMSQKHAKKICNALALSQDMTTENKSKISLSYHCSTLNDSYWVKKEGENIQYRDVSLFQNTSTNVLTPISLKGRTSSLFKEKLKNWSDIGVDGTLAKSWVRENNGYYLYKECENADGEVLASRILKELGVNHVDYEKKYEEDFVFTKCKCFTNEDIGFVPFRTLVKENADAINFIKSNYLTQYANFAVSTYLIGNEDLHDKNWGVLIDNEGNINRLAPMFDFDGCFLSYQSSKNLPFLPECEFVSESGKRLKAYNFDIDESYTVEGPTLQEVAYCYAKDSTIDLDKFDFDIIPDRYREEFKIRADEIISHKEQSLEQEEER